ncbi:MAG: hypothetical protein WAO71_10135 [Gallionella sp.]
MNRNRKIMTQWLLILSLFLPFVSQAIEPQIKFSSDDAPFVTKTRELIKASGRVDLNEHIEKCQKGNSRSCFALGVAFVFAQNH